MTSLGRRKTYEYHKTKFYVYLSHYFHYPADTEYCHLYPLQTFYRGTDFNKHGEYATNVVKALQKRYRITKINMVGHSLGNISIIYYMLQNGKNQNMPQLQKQVDIAGHFAGLNFKQVPAAI